MQNNVTNYMMYKLINFHVHIVIQVSMSRHKVGEGEG